MNTRRKIFIATMLLSICSLLVDKTLLNSVEKVAGITKSADTIANSIVQTEETQPQAIAQPDLELLAMAINRDSNNKSKPYGSSISRDIFTISKEFMSSIYNSNIPLGDNKGTYKPQNLILSTIVIGTNENIAIINNTDFREGQYIETFLIEKISSDVVYLKGNNKRKALTFDTIVTTDTSK